MGDFMHRMSFGTTGRSLIALLRHEKAQDISGNASAGWVRLPKNAETSVLVSTGDSLASRDRRGTQSLLRKQRAVVKAAHASFDAMRRLSTTRAHPRWVNEGAATDSASPDGAARGDPRHGDKFREMYDPHHPLISERALLVIEAVFVLVEFGFWYGVVFSGNIPAHPSLFNVERLSDVLLAAIIPLSGIMAARIVGQLTHRVMRLYPGTGRGEFIGAGSAVLVAGLAVIAIYSLIHSRFTTVTFSSLGAFSPPALAITFVFVVVLVGDMIARIFLVSEVRTQTYKWHRHVEGRAKRASRANRKHVHAWLDLRDATQRQLNLCERVVAAGARIISDDRSRSQVPAPELPAASAEIRRAHEKDSEHDAGSPMAVPSTEPLKLFGVHMAHVPLRVVEDAVDTLRKWPPLHQEGLARKVGGMVEKLHQLSTETETETETETAAETEPEPEPETSQESLPQDDEPRFKPMVPKQPDKQEHPEGQNGANHAVEHSDAGESEEQ